MLKVINRLMAAVSLTLLVFASQAQPVTNTPATKESKPYKVLTSGKQITIRSTKEIKHVMLWTSGGNRLVEQREINNNSYTFTIPVNGSYFFLMVGLAGGKIYTEKIGLRE